MAFLPRPQEIYKHFKGNLYQIVAIAEHSETGEQLVVYQAMYGDFRTYARPLSMFVSRVDPVKYPDVTQEFRFALQGAESDRQAKESDPETFCASGEEGIAAWEERNEATMKSDCCEENGSEQEPSLDPMVLEFLDAGSYEQRLNILSALHHRINDEMITTMAIACDIEVNEGALEERYEALRRCLLTLQKYECTRMR